jgi:hypothetical protein
LWPFRLQGNDQDNLTIDEHLFGVPVLRLARHPAAEFEQQELLTRRRQVVARVPPPTPLPIMMMS